MENSGHFMKESSLIRLDQFLKLKCLVNSGGQAKVMIQMGRIKVNGEIETRRRKQLFEGDTVEFDGAEFLVQEPLDD